MGRRGPLPKPPALRRLEGNPSGRPLPQPRGIRDLLSGYEDEPERPKAAPIGEPPEDLSPEALVEWLRVVPLLSGVLTALDRAALLGYCCAVARAAKAERYLDEHGETYVTPAGAILPRPEVKIASDSQRAALRWAEALGLTPGARKRLGIELEPAPQDTTGASEFFE